MQNDELKKMCRTSIQIFETMGDPEHNEAVLARALLQRLEAEEPRPMARCGIVGLTEEHQAVLADIFTNSERPDKMAIHLDLNSKALIVRYEDLDDGWFKELTGKK